MTGAVAGLLVLAALLAVGDWWAVYTENRRLEYVLKPATMIPLILGVIVSDPAVPSMRWWFVAALMFSLLGDVLLMLPNENLFVGGLSAFLVGHLAYIAGMIDGGVSTTGLIVGGVLCFTGLLALGPTVVKGAADRDPRLGPPVTVYMLTISVMVTCAFGAGVWAGIVGAVLFFLSDLAIGWSQFVVNFRHSRVVIMVTYHLAQGLLVLSLMAAR